MICMILQFIVLITSSFCHFCGVFGGGEEGGILNFEWRSIFVHIFT